MPAITTDAALAAAAPRLETARSDVRHSRRVAVVVAGLAAAAVALQAQQPRFDLVLAAPPIVQVHVAAAVAALALGAILLAWRKGRAFHRIAGWTWVALLGTAIATSFLILDEDGTYGWIHISSAFHAATLAAAVGFAVRRRIRWHRRLMVFTFFSGLVGAMALAFIPERLMWQTFFGF